MKHVMIDLETLGTNSNSIFLSLAAVEFELDGTMGETFYMNVDLKSAMRAGLTISAETIKWWLEQRPEIMRKMFKDTKELETVLMDFFEWCYKRNCTYFWGNSASFDLGILGNAYKRSKISLPWSYRNERCYRTVVSTFTNNGVWVEKDSTKSHDPIYDAVYQIERLTQILKYHVAE